jgi:insertion element IS1 protein InsB
MTFIAVRCPHGQSDQSVKRGKTARGPQRYLCQNTLCVRGSFLFDSGNRGCLPEVKQTIIDMSLNASGVRDTARSLHLCPHTGLRELKKQATALESVHTALLRTLNPAEVAWDLERAGEAEAERDEMGSFVGHKGNPRWLWHAIDHYTGKVLAYVFGRRKDDVFWQLKALLEPFGLTRSYNRLLGGLPPASGARRALSGQTAHPEDRAQAPDIADTHQTLGPQDALLLENHADA